MTPVISTEMVAEKTEAYTMRFWAEVFSTIHIGFSFFTSFILQSFRSFSSFFKFTKSEPVFLVLGLPFSVC